MNKAYLSLFFVLLGAVLFGFNEYVNFKRIQWETLREVWGLVALLLAAGAILGGAAVGFFWGHLRDEKELAKKFETYKADHALSMKEKEETLAWRDEEAVKKNNRLDRKLATVGEGTAKNEKRRAKEHKAAVKKLSDAVALADQKIIDAEAESERSQQAAVKASNTVRRLQKKIERLEKKIEALEKQIEEQQDD